MKNKAKILLVEDNEGDILLTKEAFSEANLSNEISVVKDGQQAIRYLNKEAGFENEKTPDIILLDLNIPKINGLDVLKIIKSDPFLKTIPVIILSTSNSEKDILQSYERHANCYLTKPVNFSNFTSLIQMVTDFWITAVQLPKSARQ
jgi:CheY-like chemotaxis protein